MTASSFLTPLLPCLDGADANTLLVTDENLSQGLGAVPEGQALLTNRWDIAEAARTARLDGLFSDFDFRPWQNNRLEAVAYRLSKEKAVVHHVANRAFEALTIGGTLTVTGAKNEGIKTFAKTLGARFGCRAETRKNGEVYSVTLIKTETGGRPLDDKNYEQLRPILTVDGKPVVSKPGLFGWDKEDQGSKLLADHLPAFLEKLGVTSPSLLDLGCGYGYLSLRAAADGVSDIVATDNCAAALIACRRNFQGHGIEGDVVAADCGDRIERRFDAVICNPPFHQGFASQRALTEKFLARTHSLLKHKGRALFVVNSFVPLERLAEEEFSDIATLVQTGRFKLVELGGKGHDF